MNLLKYRHIIWDWNGTLLNDMWLCVECVNAFLQQRGLELLTLRRYQELFDFPVIDFYRQLGFDLRADSFAQLAHEYHELYMRRVTECSLQDGVVEALTWYRQQEIGQSLLSAANQPMLNESVAHFQLGGYFQKMLGLDDNQAHSKVELGREWVAQLHHGPHEALFIGDTRHDAEVAAAIGADCVLIAAGHHTREKLLTCNVPVYESLRHLFKETGHNKMDRRQVPVQR